MKRNLLANLLTALLLFGMIGVANAATIELTWITTAKAFNDSFSGIGNKGDNILTTISVDNGGSTTLSQSWSFRTCRG